MDHYGNLENGNQFRLKLDTLIDSRMLIQANSGGGKSYAVRKLLELTHGKVQQIVIDPEGEFATLREKFDYVYAAAKDGDALAHPKTAKLLAERLLETGVSAICDIYELKPHERTTFVKLFFDAMVNAPKNLWHPCLVVLDEAHVYAPESDKSEAHGAVADLATRGRKRGFCLVAATQRISKLSKDVAAELNNKLIGRATLDVDVKRAAAELGIPVGEAMKQLRSPPMEAGQFYAFGPATNVTSPTLMKVGQVETRHPKRGERATAAPKPSKAILDLLPKLSDLPKEAEQELRSIEEFKRELTNVRRELTAAKRATPAPAIVTPSPKAEEVRKLSLALEAVMKFLAKITVSDALGEKWTDAKLKAALEAAVVKASEIANDHEERRSKAVVSLQDQARQLIERVNALLSDKTTELNISIEPPKPFAVKTAPAARYARPAAERPTSDGVSKPQQKILDAIAWLNDKGIEQPHKNTVAAVAGVSPTSGGYFNNLGAMKSAGLIDYPQPGFVALTAEGGATANPPDGDGELHEKWLEIVSEPQAKILRALIEAHPEPMQKDSLAEAVGVSPTSGGYFNNLGSLRTIGAIDYPSKGFAALTRYVMP